MHCKAPNTLNAMPLFFCLRFVVFLLALALQGKAFAASYSFHLKNTKNPEEYTVIVKAKEDILLVSDKHGLLRSPLGDAKTLFELDPGEYDVEMFFQGQVFHERLVVTPEMEGSLFIVVRKEWFSGELPLSESRKSRVRLPSGGPAPTYVLSRETGAPPTSSEPINGLKNYPGLFVGAPNNKNLFVRGMGREDTLFAYDGMHIANPLHVFGFDSAVPYGFVEGLNLHSGAGLHNIANAQGSVVDMRSRDEPMSKPTLELDVNLTATRFQFTTPLSRQLHLSFGARRSHYNWYLDAFVSDEEEGFKSALTDLDMEPVTYDYNAKLGWILPSGHVAYGLLMQSSDALSLRPNPSRPEALFFEASWELQAFVYKFNGTLISNRFVVYRTLESDSFPLLGKALGWEYNLPNSENTSFGNQTSLRLSEGLALGAGFHHTSQEQAFSLGDYRASFERQEEIPLSPVEKLESLLDRTTNVVEHDSLRRLAEANGSIAFVWGRLGGEVGTALLWNNINGQTDLNPRITLTYHPLPNAKVYVKWGRYSQVPSLWHINPKYGVPGLQNQHATHNIVGGSLSIANTFVQVEAYSNQLGNQLLPNPTFDPSYDASPQNNPRMLDNSSGHAKGVEALLKHKVGPELFAQVGYTYTLSKREVYPYVDAFELVGEPRNNGLDHTNLETERFVDPTTNHGTQKISLAAVLSFAKQLHLGTQATFTTGRLYNPARVGHVDANNNNKIDEEDILHLEDATPRQANKTRLPNRWLLDVQVEYRAEVFDGAQIALYCNLWNLHALFFDSINNVFYDESLLALNGADYKAGDDLPYNEIQDLPFMPIVGLRLVF